MDLYQLLSSVCKPFTFYAAVYTTTVKVKQKWMIAYVLKWTLYVADGLTCQSGKDS